NGNAGSRKVNIYKHIIDYHPGYDATNKTATYIGTSTENWFKVEITKRGFYFFIMLKYTLSRYG
ncbi:MAG: hypothetical protein IIW95_06835, partial [Lachnospiraceae bacterium]|nr:hypothetical protein [Lachnospiraceae bacterium]